MSGACQGSGVDSCWSFDCASASSSVAAGASSDSAALEHDDAEAYVSLRLCAPHARDLLHERGRAAVPSRLREAGVAGRSAGSVGGHSRADDTDPFDAARDGRRVLEGLHKLIAAQGRHSRSEIVGTDIISEQGAQRCDLPFDIGENCHDSVNHEPQTLVQIYDTECANPLNSSSSSSRAIVVRPSCAIGGFVAG